jgi:hypothetical protein
MLMLFVVDLVMVLSRWRLKITAMDPVPKRKNQYGSRLPESNLLYCVLGETFCNN